MHSVAMIAGIGRRNLLVSGQNRQPLPVYSRQGLASGLLDYQIHGGSNLPTGSECDVLLLTKEPEDQMFAGFVGWFSIMRC